MAIRVYKPTTAGRRNASVSDFSELTRSTPEKSLVRKKSKTGGRNSYGRITSRHRGGGHKRQYRLIDFKRWDKDGVPFRENDLYIKETYVDEGVTLKRFRARAQGRAARINKRTSHITVVVANKEGAR